MIKLGLTAAQIALKAKKLPLSKLKKMFKEYFGIDDAGLSKDQIATKLASAGQKSVMQSKNVVAAKNFLKGTGLTALGLSPFIIDDDKTPRSVKGPSKSDAKPLPTPKKKPTVTPKAPPPKPDSVKKKVEEKKKKMYMKEGKTDKDSKVEFKAVKGNTGMLASKKDLKPIPAGNKGKGLSMLGKSVRNNMGFMYGGGMPMPSKKPRMSTADYRKASKGMLIISVDMKKKPKIKKNKRG